MSESQRPEEQAPDSEDREAVAETTGMTDPNETDEDDEKPAGSD